MGVLLPPHAYTPGQTPRHPDHAFDALRGTAQPGMSVRALAASDAWQAGWVFFDQGFFWEAHEAWEPVWMSLPPNSAERHLVRAVIQFANARLKERMQRPRAARRLCELTRECLAACGAEDEVMSVSLSDLLAQLGALERRLADGAS